MEEQWRPVPGYEELYEVSDHGRVRSCRILSAFKIDRHGHVGVSLGRDNQKSVHSLVLEAFVGPRPPGLLGCHYNDIPDDNRLENLRWDTYSGNNRDIVRNGNHNNARKTQCKYGHEFTPENTVIASGGRQCRICMRRRARERMRVWRAKQKEKQ